MTRISALAVLLVLTGCASTSKPTPAQAEVPTVDKTVTEFDAAQSCVGLVDHGVQLFFDSWADHEEISKDQFVRDITHRTYVEALADQGTIQKLYAFCVTKVDRDDYECAMQAKSPEDFVRCMPDSEF